MVECRGVTQFASLYLEVSDNDKLKPGILMFLFFFSCLIQLEVSKAIFLKNTMFSNESNS